MFANDFAGVAGELRRYAAGRRHDAETHARGRGGGQVERDRDLGNGPGARTRLARRCGSRAARRLEAELHGSLRCTCVQAARARNLDRR